MSHLSWALSIGILTLLLYSVGIPLLAYKTLKSIKNNLDEYQHIYGFLYSSYEKKNYYWEIVIVSKKVCFASIAVIFKEIGVDLQAILGIIVLVTYFGLQLKHEPYVSPILDRIEMISN